VIALNNTCYVRFLTDSHPSYQQEFLFAAKHFKSLAKSSKSICNMI